MDGLNKFLLKVLSPQWGFSATWTLILMIDTLKFPSSDVWGLAFFLLDVQVLMDMKEAVLLNEC